MHKKSSSIKSSVRQHTSPPLTILKCWYGTKWLWLPSFLGTKFSVQLKRPSYSSSEVIAPLFKTPFTSLFILTDLFCETFSAFNIEFLKVFDNAGISQLFIISKISWSLVSVRHVSSWFGTSQADDFQIISFLSMDEPYFTLPIESHSVRNFWARSHTDDLLLPYPKPLVLLSWRLRFLF